MLTKEEITTVRAYREKALAAVSNRKENVIIGSWADATLELIKIIDKLTLPDPCHIEPLTDEEILKRHGEYNEVNIC